MDKLKSDSKFFLEAAVRFFEMGDYETSYKSIVHARKPLQQLISMSKDTPHKLKKRRIVFESKEEKLLFIKEAVKLREKGLTHMEIGERLGAAQNTISRWISDWESGKYNGNKELSDATPTRGHNYDNGA